MKNNIKPPKNAIYDGDYCSKKCPHYKKYNHPFYHHTVWCTYQMRELFYHDGGHIAQCQFKSPNKKLVKIYKQTA